MLPMPIFSSVEQFPIIVIGSNSTQPIKTGNKIPTFFICSRVASLSLYFSYMYKYVFIYVCSYMYHLNDPPHVKTLRVCRVYVYRIYSI